MNLSPAGAIADPDLLGAAFGGHSWDRWRAVLRAAWAEPLSDADRALFHEVAERAPPVAPVRELWAICGRRSGKDAIASAIATTAALGDYRAMLRPGERATILCLAADRAQAKIVFRYIRGYFHTVPLLQPLMVREGEESLELSTGVEIVVSANSYRSVRGRTVVCAILDEAAFFRDETSSLDAVETYNALIPSLATLPGSVLIGISSPYRRSGLLFDVWRKHYGKDGDVLVVRGATPLFNPTLPQRVIDDALERDPAAAAAEWLAEWRSDIADYIAREAVDACVELGCFERAPNRGVVRRYAAFLDAAGGAGSDSMTCAVAHAEGDIAVLDAVRERRPPFSPDVVTDEFATLARTYGITTMESDRWGGDWVIEAFRKRGIKVVPSAKPKSDLYRELVPLLSSRRCSLLDLPRLIAQLCGLERRTARGGRDSIDHAPGGHDDVANAVCGALLLVQNGRPPMNINPAILEGALSVPAPGTTGWHRLRRFG